jgi:catechol 2,3-dioxygenase-like lactoylglutathione lyase family enzyme
MPISTTLDHVTIVTDAFEASRPVYDAVLGKLGLAPALDYDDPEGESGDTQTVAAVGYTTQTGAVRVLLVAGSTSTSGAHFALAVADRVMVERAAEAGAGAGGRVVQPPREWESAQLGYYGTQIADRAGNIIEVVYRS